MIRRFYIFSVCALLTVASCARQETMEELTDRVFERAAVQLRILDAAVDSVSALKDGRPQYPRSIRKDGSLWTSSYRWWCSGFYTGSLWYVYEYTREDSFKNLALKYQAGLEPLRFRKGDHDVGFQLMCSYGNCLRLTSDTSCIPVLIDGASSLAASFSPKVGCTRSWNFGEWSFPVIIDNIMNLELLLKTAELCRSDSLRNIALSHAYTTMKNHFREDKSCVHLVDYNPETGEVIRKQTVQGHSDNSAWSRGQAWALYGYTMVYRFTKDKQMLDQAVSIAEYLLPRLPEDGVPFWDYDSPNIPNDVKDASAAAIMASALIELSTFVDSEKSSRYLVAAETMLRTLASETYLAAEGSNHGFLLRHCTGNMSENSEIDAPLTYADYYFLEALLKYRSLKNC